MKRTGLLAKSPLEDLSFFKFPDLTPGGIATIFLLLVLLVLVVMVTVMVQRWIYARANPLQSQNMDGRTREGLPQNLTDLLNQIAKEAGLKNSGELVLNARAYETVVDRLVPVAGKETRENLERLRKRFHLNVMNQNLELVSTRQLLPDLPLRLQAHGGGEMLDLYCALLARDEAFMYFEVPYDKDIANTLLNCKKAWLVFWQEEAGETLFPVKLEPGFSEEGNLIRSPHALAEKDLALRQEFRLSLESPVHYTYMAREKLKEVPDSASLRKGEGQMVDISYGGAAFLSDHYLPPGGFAQLILTLGKEPVRLMVEVISCSPPGEFPALVRGQVRGLGAEFRSAFTGYISREQIRRLREKKGFIQKREA